MSTATEILTTLRQGSNRVKEAIEAAAKRAAKVRDQRIADSTLHQLLVSNADMRVTVYFQGIAFAGNTDDFQNTTAFSKNTVTEVARTLLAKDPHYRSVDIEMIPYGIFDSNAMMQVSTRYSDTQFKMKITRN